jgi:hypothetical protein
MSIVFDTSEEKLIFFTHGHHSCSISLHLFKLAFEERVIISQDILMEEAMKEEVSVGLFEQFILFLNKIFTQSNTLDKFMTAYNDNKFTFLYQINQLDMIFEMGYNEVIFSVDLTNSDTHYMLCEQLHKILNYVRMFDDCENDEL